MNKKRQTTIYLIIIIILLGITSYAFMTNKEKAKENKWNCSEWSVCENDLQSRSCLVTFSIVNGIDKPIETQSCVSCNPNWQCSSWSNCINNQQTRSCSDLNNCGKNDEVPSLIQTCNSVCIPNWVTGSWSSCTNSQQTRTVTDSNNCGVLTNKPATTQSCTDNCEPYWVAIAPWSSCINNQQTRTLNDLHYCNQDNTKTETRSCVYVDLTNIKNLYSSYFTQNPRVKSVIESYINDLALVNMDYNWDEFYKTLQDEENGNNVGTSYDSIRLMAHSVYIDNHNLVPWKLSDYDDDALNFVFRPIYDYGMFKGTYGSYGYNPEFVYTCNPKSTYSYAKNFVKNNQINSVYAIVDFMRKYQHFGSNCDSNGNCVPSSEKPVSGCDEGVLANDQIDGCHASAQLMVDLARSINIPAFYHYNHFCHNWLIYGHGSVAFYKIGYIPHGDDVYDYVHPELKSCQLIIPWDYLVNNIIPLEGKNPQNDLHGTQCESYYHFGEGYNPAVEFYDRSLTQC